MPPTTDELYRQYILPQKEEKRRRDLRLQENKERRQRARAAGILPESKLHPSCKKYGHYRSAEHHIQKTPSGKRIARCGRCKQGFVMEERTKRPLKKEEVDELFVINTDAPKVLQLPRKLPKWKHVVTPHHS